MVYKAHPCIHINDIWRNNLIYTLKKHLLPNEIKEHIH
jgi:hypothetical protein